jgi:hypothetical protein
MLSKGYIYVKTPNAERLIEYASRQIQQLLIRVGVVKKPFQWWQLWPRVVDSIRRRRHRKGSMKG